MGGGGLGSDEGTDTVVLYVYMYYVETWDVKSSFKPV